MLGTVCIVFVFQNTIRKIYLKQSIIRKFNCDNIGFQTVMHNGFYNLVIALPHARCRYMKSDCFCQISPVYVTPNFSQNEMPGVIVRNVGMISETLIR